MTHGSRFRLTRNLLPLWLAWLALPVLPAFGGSLEGLDTDGRRVALPLEHTAVTVEVSAFVARTTVEQHFANPLDEPIEARYTFPLGEDAAVDRYEIQTGARIVRGEIMRREEARRVYDEARDAGVQAALLDQQRANVFTQSIANLAPGQPIVVRLQTIEVLKYEAGFFQFTFPAVVASRYDAGEAALPATNRSASWKEPPRVPAGREAGHAMSIRLALDAGVPIVEIGSPTHAVLVERPSATRAAIELAGEPARPDRDFVLRWGVFSTEPALGLLAHRSGVDGYFTLILQPRVDVGREEAAPKEVVLVLDTSGSMSGPPIKWARRLADRTLETLGSRDRFNIVQFASGSSSFSPTSVGSDSREVARGRSWLGKLRDGGGTEMLEGLRRALEPERDPDRIRMLVFLTDGFIGAEGPILQTIRDLPDDVRVFTVGIGSSVNHELLGRMARLGRGAYTFIPTDVDAQTAVERLEGWLTRPYLTDLEVDWGALPVEPLAASQPRDLYAGQNLLLIGRYFGGAAGPVTVRGYLGGRPWEQRLDVQLPETAERHAALASVWARKRIEAYELEAPGEVPEELREKIVELALEHRLMSAYTSFVAVDYSVVTNPEGLRKTVEQAVPEPASLDHEGLTGLATGALTETVRVAASSGVVALTRTSSSTHFSSQFVQDLPVPGRFYQNVLDGPGAEPDLPPAQLLATHVLAGGVQPGADATLVHRDSVDEVERIGPAAGAEFGRAQGGFARIVQKQGTNEFEADAGFTYRSHRADGDGSGPAAPAGFEGAHGGLRFSGPLVRDKLHYRTSHAWTDWDTPVNALVRPDVQRTHGASHDTRLVWQASPRNKLTWRVASGAEATDGVDVTSMLPRASSGFVGRERDDASLTWYAPFSPRLVVETTLSHRDGVFSIGPVDPGAAATCGATSLPAGQCFDRAGGRFTGAAPRRLRDRASILGLVTGATLYGGRWAGAIHELHFGASIDDVTLVRDVAVAPRWVAEPVGPSGEREFFVRIPVSDPGRSRATGTAWSLYIEDRVKPIPDLQIALGARLDGQEAAAGLNGDGLLVSDLGVSPYANVAWDPFGSGKTKLAAAFRRYHDALAPATLLAAFEPQSVDTVLHERAGGLGPVDGVRPALNRQLVDPALEAPRKDEWTLSFEREIATETRLRLSWVRADYRRQLGFRDLVGEDAGACRPGGAAPGLEAAVRPDLTRCPLLPPLSLPGTVGPQYGVWGDVLSIGNHERGREESFSIELDRRQYRSWEVHASYRWSRATDSAEPFRFEQGDERGLLPNRIGERSDTRRHAIRAHAVTLTPWGVRAGGTVHWLSGLPWSPLRMTTEIDGDGVPRWGFEYEGAERNTRRAPSYWNVDLKLSKQVNFGRGVNAALSIEAFNLLDDDSLLPYNPRLGLGRQIDGRLEATRRFGRWYQAGLRLVF